MLAQKEQQQQQCEELQHKLTQAGSLQLELQERCKSMESQHQRKTLESELLQQQLQQQIKELQQKLSEAEQEVVKRSEADVSSNIVIRKLSSEVCVCMCVCVCV